MALTRQQRRKRQSDLARRGAQIVKSGLPPRHPADDVVALGLLMCNRLVDRSQKDRASRTAALAAAVFETSLAALSPKEAVACRMGCAHCCKRTYVSVTAPEAFLLARHLLAGRRNADPGSGAVRAAADRLGAVAADADLSVKGDCPMLADNACTVYGVRPFACRHLASLSVDACLAIYQGQDVQVSVPSGQALVGQGVKLAFMAALEAAGIDGAVLELRQATRIALAAGDDGETRWLAGENVLSGASRDTYRPPEVARLLTSFAREIAEVANS